MSLCYFEVMWLETSLVLQDEVKMSDRIPINSDQFQAHFFLSKVDNHAL